MKHGIIKASELLDDWSAKAHLGEGPIPIPEDVAALAESIGSDPEKWRQNCHGASVTLVNSGLYEYARVARGACVGVMGQHSWVVLGDPYDRSAQIIDATLWSYDRKVRGVWTGTLEDDRHFPHGSGHFMQGAKPYHHGGETLYLNDQIALSTEAELFLNMLGDLDNRGWMEVAHLPVGGWPAREVIEAMLDTPDLGVFVPIDIQGMLTDRNPGLLYLPRDTYPDRS